MATEIAAIVLNEGIFSKFNLSVDNGDAFNLKHWATTKKHENMMKKCSWNCMLTVKIR